MKFSISNFPRRKAFGFLRGRQFPILLFAVLVLLSIPFLSLAQRCAGPLVPCGPGTAKPACELCDFFQLFKNVVDFILWCIVPPIAALFIAIGGFYFFFAEGKPENVAKGKNIIKTTLIGLVIIFAAWLVVHLFFQIIGVAEWKGWNLKEGWWKIPCK